MECEAPVTGTAGGGAPPSGLPTPPASPTREEDGEARQILSRIIEQFNADEKYRQQVENYHQLVSESIGSVLKMQELTSGPGAAVLKPLFEATLSTQEEEILSRQAISGVLAALVNEAHLAKASSGAPAENTDGGQVASGGNMDLLDDDISSPDRKRLCQASVHGVTPDPGPMADEPEASAMPEMPPFECQHMQPAPDNASDLVTTSARKRLDDFASAEAYASVAKHALLLQYLKAVTPGHGVLSQRLKAELAYLFFQGGSEPVTIQCHGVDVVRV